MRASRASSTIDLLRRRDKHYLGAGDGILFDPPHPQWLDRPGFWDGGRIFHYTLRPLFTVTIASTSGREWPLRVIDREWTPAELTTTYESHDVALEERRCVLPGGAFLSACSLHNHGARPLELALVAWTAYEGEDVEPREACRGSTDGVTWVSRAPHVQHPGGALPVACTLAFTNVAADAWSIIESEHARAHSNAPLWDVAPFADRWQQGTLRCELRLARDAPADGSRTLIYFAIARRLRLAPDQTAELAVALRAQPAEPRLRPMPPAQRTLKKLDASASRAAWQNYFKESPALTCSDAHLARYFPYRWYGLRLNFIDPAGNYRYPTCAEGPAYFHCPISYSAWCHARELRWLPDPARARGTLLTFLAHQREDGSLPGRIYLDDLRHTDFYFADWGGSLLALDEVHPDAAFLEAAYAPLTRFAEYMDRTRDADASGLYDVLDPYETGQELMSRYTAVDPQADRYHFEYRLQLKGVDLTVYMYRLRRALAQVAAALGRVQAAREHERVADRIAEAVRSRMWDASAEMFFDLDPRTLRRTGVKAAICFYPYLTDICGREHLRGLERHLLNPAEFWLPHPVPSTAADDPGFSADAIWHDVRRNCTWSGRVWPMTNSHLVDALGNIALQLDASFREHTAELLGAYVRMLFFDGDLTRPNSFEHYSPLTGRPSLYRGIDDYQHSWINDLIIRYVAGFQPRAGGGFVVDPFPCGITRLHLERLPYRGRTIDILMQRKRLRVRVDGSMVAEAPVGEPIEVAP